MADKVPVRTVFDSSGNATGLAEYQSGESVGYIHGGTGLTAIGTSGQILRVNSGASAIEYTSTILTPDGTITLDSSGDINLDAGGADIVLKDDGTEFGRFTNSSGQLVIKSSSSSTTAITMSGSAVTIAGNLTVSGTTTTVDSTTINIQNSFVFEGATDDSFETTLTTVDPTADRTLSLPNATDTLVGKATTDTLTNKSIDLGTNTLTGSLAEFNSALQSESFVSLTGSETLTNKTLTSPTITTPTILEIDSGSTITLDATTDITLDAGGADIILKDDGTEFGRFTNSAGQLVIKSSSSTTTALTMSGANVTVAGNLTVTGNATASGSTITLGDAAGDTVAFGGTITGNLVFEGSSADSFETTLAPGNPSADITLTMPASASDTLVGRATTDTLTNKTITGPTVSGLTLSDSSISFEGSTANSYETTLTVTDPTADRTITLPNATDTMVGKATTDTLTNKTLTTPTITTPIINTGASLKNGSSSAGYADFYEDSDNGTNYVRVIGPASTATVTITLPAAADTLVGKATTDTFTNKSIDLGTNTLTGSLSEFNSALQSESFVSLTGTETLTNKTLTAPAMTSTIVFEGSTADSFETTLAVTDPTADRTITLPNATGTVAMTTDTSFPQSTLTLHPAASANVDLGNITSDTTDAFNQPIDDLYDHMEPRGSITTVDLGSVAA